MKRQNLKITDIEEGEETQLQDPENAFNKIIEKKSWSEEDEIYWCTRSIDKKILTEPEKEIPSPHNNKNSKCTEKRKLRAVRRKDRVKLESKWIIIISNF